MAKDQTDIVTFEKIPMQWLEHIIPDNAFTSYLGRPKKGFSETGYYAFNTAHKYAAEFFERWQTYYDQDRFKELKGYTDSFTFDGARLELEREGKIKNEDLFLKGGMTLEIEITTDNILAYEMSPVHLSVNSDGVLYTKIVKDDEVTYKNVTIVNSGENLVNVTGLNDGDIVLTNGQAFVSLNDKIQYNIEN